MELEIINEETQKIVDEIKKEIQQKAKIINNFQKNEQLLIQKKKDYDLELKVLEQYVKDGRELAIECEERMKNLYSKYHEAVKKTKEK